MLKEMSGSLRSLPRRSWLGFVLAFVAIFIIFLWHLGNLTPGLSRQEVEYASSTRSWALIISNPINAPHKIIQLAVFKLSPQHPSLLRLASVSFALIFCLGFYRLATGWFGRAIGLFSTLIFACLPLLVVSGRQASAEIMFFCPVIFISLYNWLLRAKQYQSAAWFTLCLAAAVFVFTPGLLIWLVAACCICRKNIIKSINTVPVQFSFFGLLLIFSSVASLALASIKHHYIAKQLFLVPAYLGNGFTPVKHIGWMFLSLFVKTGQTDHLIVQRLPLLSVLSIALLIFGLYAMLTAAKSKAIWLGLSIVYAILAAGLNNKISILALGLPAIILFVAAGLRYLYIEWRSVFPRNPVPKSFALVLIAIVALVQLYFGLRYSLAAWPEAPATRAAYVLK